jgi:hypothetical protein
MDSVVEQLKNPIVLSLGALAFLAVFLFSRNQGGSSTTGTIQRVGQSEEMDKAVLDFELQKAGMMAGLFQNIFQARTEQQEAEKQRAFDLQALQLQLQASREIAQMQNAIESQRLASEMQLANLQAELQRYAIKKAGKKGYASAILNNLPEYIRIFGGLATGQGIGSGGGITTTPRTFPSFGLGFGF